MGHYGPDFGVIESIFKFAYYAFVYGITAGFGTMLTLVAALFIGSGWWMIVPMTLSITAGVALDMMLNRR